MVKVQDPIKHSKNEFTKGTNHISGIENFLYHAKHNLAKFKESKKGNFLLHTKETKFRSNTKIKEQDVRKNSLKMIRENPLKFN